MKERILFFFLVSNSLFSQTIISGKVSNEKGGVLSAVNITVIEKGTSKITAFGISKTDGTYNLKVTQDTDSLVIKVSKMNYAIQTHHIKNQNQVLDFILKEGALELKEVKVKSPPAKRYGDTLSYKVDAFKTDADRTIGDVIKKLPGIEVDATGGIKYQGESINAYYVEGLNLMGGQYGLINENLNAGTAVSVEILENHQPIRILDSLQLSERAAINIRLKKKVTASSALHYGIGFKPLLWDFNATPMLFMPGLQVLASYQANNVGYNVRNQLLNHFGERTSIISSSDGWLNIPPLNQPPFSYERWMDNNSQIASINALKKNSKSMEYRLNSSLSLDKQQQVGSSGTTYILGNEEIAYTENIKNNFHFNKFDASLQLLKNTSNKYFKNTIKFVREWSDDKGDNTRYDRRYSQNLDTENLSIANNFHTLFNKGKVIYGLYSNTIYNDRSQNLIVDFIGLDSVSSPLQTYHQKSFATHNYVNFLKKLGVVNLSFKTGNNLMFNHIDTKLLDFGNLPETINDFHWNTSSTYISATTTLSSKNKKWFSFLEIPLTHYFIQYKPISGKRSLNRIVPEPRLYIRRDFTREFSIFSNLQYKNNLASLGSVYPEYVMLNYLSLVKRDTDFQDSHSYSGGLGMKYSNTQTLTNAHLNYTIIRQSLNLLSDNTISDDGSQEVIYENKDNISLRQMWSGRFSQNIFSIRTSPFIGFIYSENQSERRLNSHTGTFSYTTFTPSFGLNFTALRKLQMEYSFNYLVMKNSSSRSKQNQQLFKLFYYPHKHVMIKGTLEHFKNNLNQNSKSYNFGDLLLRLSFPKIHQDFEISLSNLFNTRQFRTLNVSDYYYSESTYTLRPRQVIIRGRLNF